MHVANALRYYTRGRTVKCPDGRYATVDGTALVLTTWGVDFPPGPKDNYRPGCEYVLQIRVRYADNTSCLWHSHKDFPEPVDKG